MELTSKLPWWVGVVLAILSYTALHSIASQPPPSTSGDLSTSVRGTAVIALAGLCQYVLPMVFGFGAIVSFVASWRRRTVHSDVTSNKRSLDSISWKEFEYLMY